MRKTFLAVLTAALIALGGAAAALYFYDRPTTLEVAVPQLAEDQRMMNAAAHLFAQERKPIRLHLVSVADSAASMAMLDAGQVDLALARSDIAVGKSGQTLAILHRNAALLMAPGQSKLKRAADLRGKRIGVVHEIATMEPNARLLDNILSQYDIAPEAVSLTPLSLAELQPALQQGKVDAIFTTATAQNGPMNEVVTAVASATKKALVFIPIDEAKAISKRFPALEPMEIVQGAFGGDPPRPSAAVESLSVSMLLLARHTLRDDMAAQVTRLFFSNRGALAQAAPLANSIEAPSTDRGGAIPVHQGAADYLDGNERSFFERYNDAFYIGAMLLSLVGSGAAALASRFNANSHERIEQVTEGLLEILKAAREAGTQAELDGLERRTDKALTDMLADRKLRYLDKPPLHMATLALDQARRAIEERRASLARERRMMESPALPAQTPAKIENKASAVVTDADK